MRQTARMDSNTPNVDIANALLRSWRGDDRHQRVQAQINDTLMATLHSRFHDNDTARTAVVEAMLTIVKGVNVRVMSPEGETSTTNPGARGAVIAAEATFTSYAAAVLSAVSMRQFFFFGGPCVAGGAVYQALVASLGMARRLADDSVWRPDLAETPFAPEFDEVMQLLRRADRDTVPLLEEFVEASTLYVLIGLATRTPTPDGRCTGWVAPFLQRAEAAKTDGDVFDVVMQTARENLARDKKAMGGRS